MTAVSTTASDMNSAEGALASATQLAQQGRYEEAFELVKPWTTDDVLGHRATYIQAYAELFAGHLLGAEARFSELLENSAEHRANSAYYLGEIALQRGETYMAVCFFSGALTIQPGHKGALEKLSNQRVPAYENRPPPQQAPSVTPAAAQAPRAESSGQVVKHPPRTPTRRNSTIGIVTEVRGPIPVPTLAGPASAQQYDIEFEQYDREGLPLGPSFVYLRGVKIKGAVAKGQWIELAEGADSDGRVRRLVNLSTGREVASKSSIFFPGS